LLIALLPPRLLRHLEFVVGRSEALLKARTWAELEAMLQVEPVSVALIDPSADGASKTVEFQRITAAYPSLPILAYVPLTPAAFKAVAQLSAVGLEHVILYSHDDSADRLISTIDKVRSSPLTDRFLAALEPALAELPLSIAKAVEELFAEPHRYPNAQDIAASANVSLVRLYRAFQSAGFAAPRKVVIAARLLRAYRHLTDPGQSVGGVASKLAYRSPRIFAEHTHEVFGMNPSRLATFLTEDQAVDALLASVVKA
jgi:AraC-like DNA-binding protein